MVASNVRSCQDRCAFGLALLVDTRDAFTVYVGATGQKVEIGKLHSVKNAEDRHRCRETLLVLYSGLGRRK